MLSRAYLEDEGKRRYLYDPLFHARAVLAERAYPGASLEAIVGTLMLAEYVPSTTGENDGAPKP